MSNYKKAVAALTAIISMASLGVGTISASAADLDAINEKILNDTASDEEKFVAEYANDSEEMKVAEYVINSGISESDAELAMQIYEDGARNSNIKDFSNDNFYNSDNLAPTQHYMLTIFKGQKNAYRGMTEIVLNTANVRYGGTYTAFDDFDDYIDTFSCSYGKKTDKFVISLTSVASKLDNYVRLVEFPFDYINTDENSIDEASAHNSLVGDKKALFAYESYAMGDVDHNGIVDSTDSSYVMKYVVGSTNLGFAYKDCTADISGIVNREAADYDDDGKITISDVVALNKYLAN